MLVAERFIQSLVRKYGKHNISTDGGNPHNTSSSEHELCIPIIGVVVRLVIFELGIVKGMGLQG